MKAIKAIDIQTEEKFDLPKTGEGNWLEWLAEQRYLICDRIPLGYVSFEVYRQEETEVYALYHPVIQGLETECLFFNIPDEATVQELISLAKKMMGIMSQLSGLVRNV